MYHVYMIVVFTNQRQVESALIYTYNHSTSDMTNSKLVLPLVNLDEAYALTTQGTGTELIINSYGTWGTNTFMSTTQKSV